jgi:hypothetical protein
MAADNLRYMGGGKMLAGGAGDVPPESCKRSISLIGSIKYVEVSFSFV